MGARPIKELLMTELYMIPSLIATNVDWQRLCLQPITTDLLKTRIRTQALRVAFYTGEALHLAVLTRHPRVTGRKAKRVAQGYWEVYEMGKGWVQIDTRCECWLMP
jgi:hypothetical protein